MTADEKPFAEKLYNETLSHIKQTDLSVPYRKHGYWYYTRTEEGKQYAVLCRKKESLSAPEEVMLDVNELAKGEKFMSLGGFQVSDDSNLLAYTTDNVGFRQYRLHVKDLRTGQVLPDTAERIDSLDLGCGQQDAFLQYGRCADQAQQPCASARVSARTPAKDPVVFEEKDERYDVRHWPHARRQVPDAGIGKPCNQRSEVSGRRALPTGEWKMIEPRKEGIRYDVDEGNGTFYIRVNDTDPSYRLVTAPVATPGKAHWTELIAARKDVPIEDVDVFKNFYVVTERQKGLPVLQVYDERARRSAQFRFPSRHTSSARPPTRSSTRISTATAINLRSRQARPSSTISTAGRPRC